jgi:hypothetical protein
LTNGDVAKAAALFGLGVTLMGGYMVREVWKLKANARRHKKPWE